MQTILRLPTTTGVAPAAAIRTQVMCLRLLGTGFGDAIQRWSNQSMLSYHDGRHVQRSVTLNVLHASERIIVEPDDQMPYFETVLRASGTRAVTTLDTAK